MAEYYTPHWSIYEMSDSTQYLAFNVDDEPLTVQLRQSVTRTFNAECR